MGRYPQWHETKTCSSQTLVFVIIIIIIVVVVVVDCILIIVITKECLGGRTAYYTQAEWKISGWIISQHLSQAFVGTASQADSSASCEV